MRSEEKAPPQRVRLVVSGSPRVGKSALTVRYLTGRFIGEYRSNTDLLYKKKLKLENGFTEVEIVDVYAGSIDDFPMAHVRWSDVCVVVYSITSRASFEYAAKCMADLKSVQNGPIIYLIGNKADLDHLREVEEIEGAALAASFTSGFCEVSVAEYTPNISNAFDRLLLDARARPNKARKFSMSKMLGTLIGTNNNNSKTETQGTVVPWHKSDLLKSRVWKRRQGFAATTSL